LQPVSFRLRTSEEFVFGVVPWLQSLEIVGEVTGASSVFGKTQLTHDIVFGKGFSFTDETFSAIDAALADAFPLASNGADTVHFSLLAFSCGMF
jgi:hypothetical protein